MGRKRDLFQADVVIIGAGLSGLVAAQELAGRGADVIVLEAKNHVGGRTLNQPLSDGNVVEAGGEWMYPYHEKLATLAENLGVKVFPQYDEGDRIAFFDSVVTRQTNGDAGMGGATQAAFQAVLGKLETLSRQIDPAAPWLMPNAHELDAQTLAGWLTSNLDDPIARRSLDMSFGLQFGAPLSRVSFLWALTYIASFGGFCANLLPTERWRFHGGSQLLSLRLAERLGKRVHLNSPVRSVAQASPGGVEVVSDRLLARADHCVVALSPADCRRIRFDPLLPSRRRILQESWQCGPQIKAHAVYPRAFWRDDGLSGFARSDQAPASLVFDNSPPDGSQAVLIALFQPSPGPSTLGLTDLQADSADRRREAVLDVLVAMFGDQAATPEAFFEQNWQNIDYTAGCQPFYPPGLLTTTQEAIRQRCGRIHWASTETAARCPGWMEGAIDAGQRAAHEVIDIR